eukprot:sb/3471577/
MSNRIMCHDYKYVINQRCISNLIIQLIPFETVGKLVHLGAIPVPWLNNYQGSWLSGHWKTRHFDIQHLLPPRGSELTRTPTHPLAEIHVDTIIVLGCAVFKVHVCSRYRSLISGWAWYLYFQPEAKTIMTSVLALVGVGAGIKSLSQPERSRDKTKGTKMISVLELVGVGAKIKSLSHLVN